MCVTAAMASSATPSNPDASRESNGWTCHRIICNNLTVLDVLHINFTDHVGGGGRAAYRIHLGLKQLGVRSHMLVGKKAGDEEDVDLLARRQFRILDDLSKRILDNRLSLQYLFYPSSFSLVRHPWFKEADIVQLYVTHGGYFSHTALPMISRRRPVVWRLSDMWPMTGHCAHSFDCEGWKTGCGSCPIIADYPGLRRDTTATLWRIKNWSYTRSALTFVAPSKWIAGLAEQSPLIGRFPVHVIPTGVDTETFRPIPKEAARQVLGIEPSQKVVLFSAQYIQDRNKGGLILEEALEHLAVGASSDLMLLVVGGGAHKWNPKLPFEVKRLGYVFEETMMAAVYSAADVFVLPTMAETFPNGVLESMACGTPPVTFDVGGCPEAVRHMETGYVARYRDAVDLAAGIELLLTDDELRRRLSERARAVAESEYTMGLQASRFKHLYEEVLAERGARAASG